MVARMEPGRDISVLLAIMRQLRNPDGGCPWDLEQTFASVAPYTVEEAHEVADAIARGDTGDLCDELGDLLLQVVFHAQMAEEAGLFGFGDVVEAITRKMIRRHPHVFADGPARNSGAVKDAWAEIKAEEKAERRARRSARGLPPEEEEDGALAGVSGGLPALQQALKLQEKAAKVGFDWSEAPPILSKIREEIDEIEAELHAVPREPTRIADELGDLVFAVVNLGRHLGVDPEQAARGTSQRFRARFRAMEAMLAAEGARPQDRSLDELEGLWIAAKRLERAR